MSMLRPPEEADLELMPGPRPIYWEKGTTNYWLFYVIKVGQWFSCTPGVRAASGTQKTALPYLTGLADGLEEGAALIDDAVSVEFLTMGAYLALGGGFENMVRTNWRD